MRLSESAIDTSKIWFHGSSEAKVTQFDPPSYEHPFYVTSDLHYAMAFCTKSSSNTGDWGFQKTFTPASQNYVYVVSLKPDCKAFDFKNKNSAEFKSLYKVIDKDIVDWVLQSKDKFDRNDIYDFIVTLELEVLKPIEEDKTYSMYYDRHITAAHNPLERIIPEEVFEKAKEFMYSNGLEHAHRDMDIHEIMAPVLKKLNALGFQGIMTAEHDSNDEVSMDKVTTSNAIGIFDKSGLDLLCLIPMKYAWLKKINPTYLQDKTSENANQKIRRFIQLYKQIAKSPSSISESSLDTSAVWYFGNNRSKNLRIAKPSWNAPFFLTTSYEYAEEYSDYGVYKIELSNEKSLNILDFNNNAEVNKLKWPRILIDKIQDGKNDLNSIAYDMYILAFGTQNELMYIQRTSAWQKAAQYFKEKSKGIFKRIQRGTSVWGDDNDHAFVLQMWKDIHDAGFDGFTHIEFGKKILALFNFHCIDKISVKPIDKLDEETFCEYVAHEVVQQGYTQYDPPYTLQQIKAKYPQHIYSELANDPVHRWRAETGIELIHKEPTEEELDRIWKNWQLMTQEMKDISDKKSLEMFGCTNAEHYNKLKASEDHLNENKATYLQKYRDESDVKSIVDMFWAIRNRLNAPQNDIDWWIKKPFNDLKSFVQNYNPANKKQRRDANYKQQAVDNGAKLLNVEDGYEIWYVPTYDAMVTLGRFYKGRSAKWCVASDDPEFWFDNHEDSEFVVLVREHPQHDEFDKVAIEMMNHGRYYNEDDIIPWDLENEDRTFTDDSLIHKAWLLFKDNNETRKQYFG